MKIKKGFTLRTVMDQSVVMAEGSNSDSFDKLISLNPTATVLWNELKGKTFDEQTAADVLVARFGIDREQALSDAGYFINKMADKGLLDK